MSKTNESMMQRRVAAVPRGAIQRAQRGAGALNRIIETRDRANQPVLTAAQGAQAPVHAPAHDDGHQE